MFYYSQFTDLLSPAYISACELDCNFKIKGYTDVCYIKSKDLINLAEISLGSNFICLSNTDNTVSPFICISNESITFGSGSSCLHNDPFGMCYISDQLNFKAGIDFQIYYEHAYFNPLYVCSVSNFCLTNDYFHLRIYKFNYNNCDYYHTCVASDKFVLRDQYLTCFYRCNCLYCCIAYDCFILSVQCGLVYDNYYLNTLKVSFTDTAAIIGIDYKDNDSCMKRCNYLIVNYNDGLILLNCKGYQEHVVSLSDLCLCNTNTLFHLCHCYSCTSLCLNNWGISMNTTDGTVIIIGPNIQVGSITATTLCADSSQIYARIDQDIILNHGYIWTGSGFIMPLTNTCLVYLDHYLACAGCVAIESRSKNVLWGIIVDN